MLHVKGTEIEFSYNRLVVISGEDNLLFQLLLKKVIAGIKGLKTRNVCYHPESVFLRLKKKKKKKKIRTIKLGFTQALVS